MDSTYFIPLRRLAASTPGVERADRFLLDEFVADAENAWLRIWLKPCFFRQPFGWPMVIYGPSGSGKTALAESLLGQLAEFSLAAEHPAVWRRLAGDDFQRLHHSAIETNTIGELRRQLVAHSGGLILDGLIAPGLSSGIQQELIYLVDRAAKSKCRLVFTCLSPPWSDLRLDAQLSSRLCSGLAIPVRHPGKDARRTIITRICEQLELRVDRDSIEYLTHRWRLPVLAIRRNLSRLAVSVRPLAGDNQVSLQQIKYAISGNTDCPGKSEKQTVLRIVSRQFGVSIKAIRGSSRRRDVVRARSAAIYLMREVLEMSFRRIGAEFGGRDQSTIRHAYNSHLSNQANEETPDLQELCDSMRLQLAERLP